MQDVRRTCSRQCEDCGSPPADSTCRFAQRYETLYEEWGRPRVLQERGWTREHFESLEKSQKPLDFKRASADHRVVNNSDINALRQQLEDVFGRILSGS